MSKHADGLRTFDTGACRDTNEGKIDPEAALSPLVLRRYAEYSAKHAKLPDGNIRQQDNWQLGIPRAELMKSLWRHFLDVWGGHRGISVPHPLEDALCALMFNAMAYLHSLVDERDRK